VSSDAELLARYVPFLQYDSLEAYPADSVAVMTDCVPAGHPGGNTLNRLWKKTLAAAEPAAGQLKLEPGLLRAKRYGSDNGPKVRAGDHLDAVGKRYVEDAREMHARDGYADQVYGYANRNQPGELWLQYWLFFYYNDKAMLGSGRHEGDWELVQVRIGSDGEPDAATYSQHTNGESAIWGEIEMESGPDGPSPVVYVARGSHACYFRPGTYKQAPIVPDYCDARGPRLRPQLNVISGDDPGWVGWPGRWGSTRHWLKLPWFTLGADSPPGPLQHSSWQDPHAFHAGARSARDLPPVVGTGVPTPARPTVEAQRSDGRAIVAYELPEPTAGEPPSKTVILSLDGHKDGLPPATYSFEAKPGGGRIELPLELEDRPYTVRAAAADAEGFTSPATSVELPAPAN
jgi:hypothetical protein